MSNDNQVTKGSGRRKTLSFKKRKHSASNDGAERSIKLIFSFTDPSCGKESLTGSRVEVIEQYEKL